MRRIRDRDQPRTSKGCHQSELTQKKQIDKPLQSTNVLERIERCLRRVGVILGRVSETTGITWCVGLAAACVRWAVELHAAIVALDGWDPGWRGEVG